MNEQLIELAASWAEKYPDFLDNFLGMVQEYRALALSSGVDLESLTATKACLTQVSDLFDSLEDK